MTLKICLSCIFRKWSCHRRNLFWKSKRTNVNPESKNRFYFSDFSVFINWKLVYKALEEKLIPLATTSKVGDIEHYCAKLKLHFLCPRSFAHSNPFRIAINLVCVDAISTCYIIALSSLSIYSCGSKYNLALISDMHFYCK